MSPIRCQWQPGLIRRRQCRELLVVISLSLSIQLVEEQGRPKESVSVISGTICNLFTSGSCIVILMNKRMHSRTRGSSKRPLLGSAKTPKLRIQGDTHWRQVIFSAVVAFKKPVDHCKMKSRVISGAKVEIRSLKLMIKESGLTGMKLPIKSSVVGKFSIHRRRTSPWDMRIKGIIQVRAVCRQEVVCRAANIFSIVTCMEKSHGKQDSARVGRL